MYPSSWGYCDSSLILVIYYYLLWIHPQARTCVLAAANPVGGHYDRAKTIAANLKINAAVLSRFDLVFILLDRPDAKFDTFLASYIHSASDRSTPYASTSGMIRRQRSESRIDDDDDELDETTTDQRPLHERLRLDVNEQIDRLPCELMQKYISHARKTIQPKMSTVAAQVLKEFYLELRQMDVTDRMPVTTRQLEALIRLTQARAKADLSEVVTLQHAYDVLDIIRMSMADLLAADEDGSSQQQQRSNIKATGNSHSTQVNEQHIPMGTT